MNLMIIESPGKIEKLSAILGPSWKIAASVGHVRDLPVKEIGVEAPDFIPAYDLTDKGAGVVAKLRGLVKAADAVYLATDPDREGEAISWHLQQALRLDNPLRVTFNEITPTAVRAALAAPRTIDLPLVRAQEARRVLDRLVGYMVSPELSRQTGERLSAGRVQSVAVRLVVEREEQIQRFRQRLHFGAQLNFAGAKTDWQAEWLTSPDFVSEDEPYFTDRSVAEAVAGVREVEVIEFEDTVQRRSPPAPFTTSTLQQAASATLGLDPKDAMEAAQALYEQGHITYHRTDNPNVSDDALGEIYAVAVKVGLAMADEPRRFKAKAGAQEGHPATTPTHWEVEEAGETPAQRALYKLIRLRAIACQLADAEYAVRTVTLAATDQVAGRSLHFQARGRTLQVPGWLSLVDGDQTEEGGEGEDESECAIPQLVVGWRLKATDGRVLEKKTKQPPRFTQATLVKKLEAEGIGRPATYASIMDNIITRDYVRLDGRRALVPTDTAALIVSSLAGHFAFMDVGFTRDVEEDLDRIAQGQLRYAAVIRRVHDQLREQLSTLNIKTTPKFPCPDCHKAMRRNKGKSGFWWGCGGFPTCTTTLPDVKGVPGTRPVASEFLCEQCSKPLVRRTKKGRGGFDFYGCTGYSDGCRASYEITREGKPNYRKAA